MTLTGLAIVGAFVLGVVATLVALWLARAVDQALHFDAAPETQDDDFTTSLARWGHLSDRREG